MRHTEARVSTYRTEVVVSISCDFCGCRVDFSKPGAADEIVTIYRYRYDVAAPGLGCLGTHCFGTKFVRWAGTYGVVVEKLSGEESDDGRDDSDVAAAVRDAEVPDDGEAGQHQPDLFGGGECAGGVSSGSDSCLKDWRERLLR